MSATALIDSGSTSTFISPKFVSKAGLEIVNNDPIPVKVANGGTLYTGARCVDVPYMIQQHQFISTFRLLNLKGYDIVLGCDWIYHHSPLTLNLKTRELTIHKDGLLELTLPDISVSPSNFMISAPTMEKLLTQDVVGAVLYCHSIHCSALTEIPTPPLLAPVLA